MHIPSAVQIVNLVDFEECNPPASPRARLSGIPWDSMGFPYSTDDRRISVLYRRIACGDVQCMQCMQCMQLIYGFVSFKVASELPVPPEQLRFLRWDQGVSESRVETSCNECGTGLNKCKVFKS